MGVKEDNRVVSDAMRILGKRTSDRKKKSSANNAAKGRKAWLKKQRRMKKEQNALDKQILG